MIPLSDRDIMDKLQGRTNIFMYSDLGGIEDVDDLLKDDSCVILYENKPRNGHWVCLVRYKDKGTIEFFDSYGLFPDKQKDHMNKRFLRDTQQTYNKIAELLWNARDRYRSSSITIDYRNGARTWRHVVDMLLPGSKSRV